VKDKVNGEIIMKEEAEGKVKGKEGG